MTSSGLVDGSWELSVVVTNVQTTEKTPTERTLRVKGDLHVGGVMLKLVEALGTLCKSLVFGAVTASSVKYSALVAYKIQELFQ